MICAGKKGEGFGGCVEKSRKYFRNRVLLAPLWVSDVGDDV